MVVIWSDWKRYLLDRGEMQCQENFKTWNGSIHILHTDHQAEIWDQSRQLEQLRALRRQGVTMRTTSSPRFRWRRLQTKRRNKFACSKISSSTSAMLFWCYFPKAPVILTLPLTEMLAKIGSAIVRDRPRLCGNNCLCDRLRSAICDPRLSAIIWKPVFNHVPKEPARLARLLLHAYQIFLTLLSTAEPNT